MARIWCKTCFWKGQIFQYSPSRLVCNCFEIKTLGTIIRPKITVRDKLPRHNWY